MIPPIWFLEINRINVKLGREPLNQTEGEALKLMIEQGLISKANINDKTVCFVLFLIFSPKTNFVLHLFKFMLSLSSIGFSFPKGEQFISMINHRMMHDYINIFYLIIYNNNNKYGLNRLIQLCLLEFDRYVFFGSFRSSTPCWITIMMNTHIKS